MNKTKLALTLLILSLPFLYRLWPVKTPSDSGIGTTTTLQVNASKVEEVDLAQQIEALGSVDSIDKVSISPELAGQIYKIYFKPGAYVKKGTLLIQLDDTIYRSQLNAVKAKLKLSKMNYLRTQQLSNRHISSQQELDKALADLQADENELDVKQAQLDKLSLKAPFSGVLGAKTVSVGQYVGIGQGLVELVANQTLKVDYRVSEHYLADLQLNQQVIIKSDAYPDKIFQGTVDYISPTVDPETRSIQVQAIVDNKHHFLAAGLFVNVTQIIGKHRKTLLIPEESLMPTIKGQQVFLIKENKANATDVIIGPHHEGKVEILSGLNPGDKIVTRGQQKLKDGSLVNIEDENA